MFVHTSPQSMEGASQTLPPVVCFTSVPWVVPLLHDAIKSTAASANNPSFFRPSGA
jgi:hypothetical protein